MAWTGLNLLPPSIFSGLRNNPFGATANPVFRTGGATVLQPQSPAATQQTNRNNLKAQALANPQGFARTTNPVTGVPGPTTAPSGANIPAFLNNPAAVLGDAMLPYADILSRIFGPQPAGQGAGVIPPELAKAYADAAAAQAARTRAQTDAIQSAIALPGQIADLNFRANQLVGSGQSLYGLPTGLGYVDPAAAYRNRAFDLSTQLLPGSTLGRLAQASATGSGWLPALPRF